MNRTGRDSGLMLLDAIVALAILGVLLGVLASAMAHHRHVLSRMDTQRRLNRLAEGVLTDLQQYSQPDVPSWEQETEPTYSIKRMDTPGPSEAWIWVQVSARFENQQALLTGLVPVQSLGVQE